MFSEFIFAGLRNGSTASDVFSARYPFGHDEKDVRTEQ
jgi:hypothetical protein